ncbi:MAG: 3-deoxy-D-manno-octulosonate 8-phosphate phosphatase [Chloroherpetonaceae bacterium]|nr:3-deoxy-D-manno-octulosonate 8-phosphate phosphatase [Chloroherpetonaceae bacterium]
MKSNIITIQEAKQRASRLKLVLTDNDGVLTDTGVYYSERGEELKRFSIRDGMGVERLRNIGVETAIITGELSGSVKMRAEKLKMPFLYLGVKDKYKMLLDTVLHETGYKTDEIAYIGDDINDVDIMNELGKHSITACPLDAMEVVKRIALYVCKAPGGNGAFRDFAEYIIKLRS